MTRRRLLATGGASGAAALVALNPRLAAAAGALAGDPAHLRRSSYAGHVGESFDVGLWGSADKLTLVSVNDIGGPDLAGRDDVFSLTFSGPDSLAVGKDALLVGNRRLGAFALFVTPVGPAARTPQFEAIVNRSVGVDRPKAPQPPPRPPAPPTAPEAAHRFVSRVRARRTAHGVRFDVVFVDGSRAKQAHAWLLRRERVVATFGWRAIEDHRTVMRLRRRALAPGRYVLVIGSGRKDGSLARVPVKLR